MTDDTKQNGSNAAAVGIVLLAAVLIIGYFVEVAL